MENNAFIDANGKLVIPNAQLLYRNFSGEESGFNRAGDRNFCVIIEDPDLASELQELGWNVKVRKPREEDDPVVHYIKVNVSYRFRAPRIFRHIGEAAIQVDEDTVGELDKDYIIGADLVVNPSKWEKGANKGISGYLESLDAVIKPDNDYFKDKYAR